jgi:hypothetical protein
LHDDSYGKCLFTGASGASFTLAEELASAARSEMMMKSMPPRIDNVEKYSAQYWQEIINGTGDQYYVYPEGDRTVNVFDYKQCVEVSSLGQYYHLYVSRWLLALGCPRSPSDIATCVPSACKSPLNDWFLATCTERAS